MRAAKLYKQHSLATVALEMSQAQCRTSHLLTDPSSISITTVIYQRPKNQISVHNRILLETCLPGRKPFYSHVFVNSVKFFTNAVRPKNEHWIKVSSHFEVRMSGSLTGYFR